MLTTDDFFKEGDQLVYAIHYDNCESYEDHYDWFDRIFSTWEEAEEYLNQKEGYRKVYLVDWVLTEELNCSVNQPFWYNDNRKSYDILGTLVPPLHGEYTIEIWNLSTGKQVPFDNIHIHLVEDDNS